MTKRIILSSDGVKISKPGIDVTKANDNDLLFSSDKWYLSLVEKGSFIASRRNVNPTVYFKNSYDFPPTIFFRSDLYRNLMIDTTAAIVLMNGDKFNRFQVQGGQSGIVDGLTYYWWAYL